MDHQLKSSPEVLVMIIADTDSRCVTEFLTKLSLDFRGCRASFLVVGECEVDDIVGTISEPPSVGKPSIHVLSVQADSGRGYLKKLGFHYATENGFSVVVALHSSCQPSGQSLASLIRPILSDEADAVLGIPSECDHVETAFSLSALFGRAAKRVCSIVFSKIAGASEKHIRHDYSAVAVHALKQLPFEYNENDDRFDFEFFIQLRRAGLRMAEVHLTAGHAVNASPPCGLADFLCALRAIVHSRCNDLGVQYDKKFDCNCTEVLYDLKMGYPSSHTLVLEEVPSGSKVLDVGCGPGLFSAKLKEKGCRVHGLDRSRSPDTANYLDAFVLSDLDKDGLNVPLKDYDHILLMDIIEHLDSPEGLLEEIRHRSPAIRPTVIITVPNVGFFLSRLSLLSGNFQYGKQGVLDFTHKRLFTVKSLKTLLQQCGYHIECIKGIPGPYPKALGPGLVSHTLVQANLYLARLWPGLFAYQVFARAYPKPTYRQFLIPAKPAVDHRSKEAKSS